MTYAYARVSTKEQNTARQLDAFAKLGGIDVVIEEHGSGKDFEGRREYQRLRRKLRKGDTLVVMSLDRFGRNYNEILDEWRHLTKKIGVLIKVIDMPILNTTPEAGLVGQFIADIVLQLLSFVAQNERERIHERQAQGIAAAQARGVRFGRPNHARPERYDEIKQQIRLGIVSIGEGARILGLSRSSLYRWCKLEGVKSTRKPFAKSTAAS